jgi:DNA-binding response OmpR family regulator/nitrogen-specific signal transduction histidine kinase
LQDINLELNRTRHELENKAVELEKSSKYKSEFLSNMSHELRTPMNSMLILSQQLAQNEEGNLTKQQVEAAQIVYNSGNDLLALINEILDLSKIEAGKMSIIIEKVWLSDIANIITTHFTPVIDKKGLALHINIDKMLPDSIMTDHQRLNQILKNLVSNAIKFTAKGSITVDFHRPDPKKYLSRSNLAPHKTLAISVIDTGIGIPKDKQQEIFGVFQQVDGSISRKYGGTGLGLSISRELAKLLDGEIQLTSISGQGSTFTIYIPENFKIDNEMEEKMLPLCPFQEKPLSLGSKKQYNDIYSNINDARNNIEKNDRVILFIEDDLKLAKILYQFGHRNGFKCIHAQDGNMGIKLAEQYIPDAILLDIRFYKNIIDVFKANLKICHIPMHIIPVETLYLDVFKKDVIGFLIKPVTEKQLKVVFSKVVNVKAKEIKQMLIIENEVNLQQCIEKFLKNNKVKVTTVGTGEMGLQNLRTISYDCMVLDLTLPDMSGFSILRKLVEEDISIPLIIVCSQELTLKEHEELQAYTRSIVFKDVKFEEQLRDEITLFLHRIVENLPAQKQNKRNKTSL